MVEYLCPPCEAEFHEDCWINSMCECIKCHPDMIVNGDSEID